MKQAPYETIAAIATPLGVGGVGIVRVSGQEAKPILEQLFVSSNGAEIDSHRMLFGWLVDPAKAERVDQVLACFMRGPKSYTGEDVVEFYCHGGIAVLQRVLDLALGSGARLAQRGEFTKRAFLNGKVDLAQAEAVLDLVSAQTRGGAGFAARQLEGRLSKIVSRLRAKIMRLLAELEASIDFPEDLPEPNYKGIQNQIKSFTKEIDDLILSAQGGRVYREGLAAVIIGKPNVGKSCLLNALLQEERVIVSDAPGTTRDSIEETLSIEGLPLRIIDTAGIRHPKDQVEEFGVERTQKELENASFVLLVLDGSQALDELDRVVINKAKGSPGVVVLNKVDLGFKIGLNAIKVAVNGLSIFKTSALYGKGIQELKQGILKTIRSHYQVPKDGANLINSRHQACLERARDSLKKALVSAQRKVPPDFVTIDLKSSILALGEVTGELVSDEVINTIFGQFCVGK